MSVQTRIKFLNANASEYRDAMADPESKKEWEENYGPIDWTPGIQVTDLDDLVEETDEEYGGWIIKLSDIPKEVTHIKIVRG